MSGIHLDNVVYFLKEKMELLEVSENGSYFLELILCSKMQYNSLLLFVFFLLFLGIFFLCRDVRQKQVCILLGNIVFYVWAGWQPILIVLVSGLIVFIGAIEIEKPI